MSSTNLFALMVENVDNILFDNKLFEVQILIISQCVKLSMWTYVWQISSCDRIDGDANA